MNVPAKFTQVDIKRALKAVRAVDPELTVRILPDGSILAVKAAEATPAKALEASEDIRL